MEKFDGIMICTDLDGTLLSSKNVISKENLDAIEYFKANGGYFTFITGRVPITAQSTYETIKPNIPFGCINGAGIYDHREQKYLWLAALPECVKEMLECVEREMPDMGIQINTANGIYFCKNNDAMQWFRDITGVPNLTCDYRTFDQPIAKIIFADFNEKEIEKLMGILHSHPLAEEFDFIRSEKNLYEILPKGISKGSVMMKMVELLGIDPEKTVAIGDYNNDISMIKAAKLGVAVANAVPEAKAVADHITVSNDEHAIAKIIYDIEKGILKI